MKIKVCGMCCSENIAEISLAKPDFMGFIFYESSPRYAGNIAPEALDVLPESTLRVGVFVNAPQERVEAVAEQYKLDFLQLHGDESPEYCARLAKHHKIIKAFGIAADCGFETTDEYETACEFFLFDTKSTQYGGSGMRFNHRLLKNYRGKTPFLLSGGIALPDAVNPAISSIDQCIALDINSRFEISPGIKDVVAVKNFIKIVRNKQNHRK